MISTAANVLGALGAGSPIGVSLPTLIKIRMSRSSAMLTSGDGVVAPATRLHSTPFRPLRLPLARRHLQTEAFLAFHIVRSKITSVQQPGKLETLDDLLAQAAHYAGFCMRNSGKMAPTLFLIGAEGPLMFVPASLTDENEKDAFTTTARLVCIAHAATACVMALKAWMKTATPRFD